MADKKEVTSEKGLWQKIGRGISRKVGAGAAVGIVGATIIYTKTQYDKAVSENTSGTDLPPYKEWAANMLKTGKK